MVFASRLEREIGLGLNQSDNLQIILLTCPHKLSSTASIARLNKSAITQTIKSFAFACQAFSDAGISIKAASLLSTIRPHKSTTSSQSSAGEWRMESSFGESTILAMKTKRQLALYCFCPVRPASHTYESHPCLVPSQPTSLSVSDAEEASVASQLQHECMLPCLRQHLYAQGVLTP